MPEIERAEESDGLVAMRQVWKRFPGVVANEGVDLDLRAGEIHALLGENGAGKSTLMNILAGWHRPDAGEIRLRGRPVEIESPGQAIRLGIGMVHQHFRLVDNLTVAENVHLGWDRTPWHLSKQALAGQVEAIAHQLGYSLDPNAQIWQLSVGEQQRVEIVRVLARGATVLILDEPTAALTPLESAGLVKAMRNLASSGRTVVFISHKLEEVLEVSDRVTVLRRGANVGTRRASECSPRLLARLMVGQEVALHSYQKANAPGPVVLELKDVSAIGDRGLPAVRGVSLSVRQGEILGIAGVAGNGQRELSEVLAALRPMRSGSIAIDGVAQVARSPRQVAEAGVGHIPEDRLGRGLFADLPVTHSAILRSYHRSPIRRGMWLNREAIARFAGGLVKRGDVRLADLGSRVGDLSGGNQQKLLARREIEIAGRLLIAIHPTRGLDVAATEDVRRELVNHRDSGKAVLLISEDLDEVLELSDRVAVMYAGRIIGVFDRAQAQREDIGLLMGGSTIERKGGEGPAC